MNSFSHYIIGSYLQKYLRDEYGVQLSAAQFLYWNIMPDFRRPFSKPPHKADSWETYLKSEIEALVCHEQTDGRFGPDYSKRLGVICHFYSDFFCFCHTPGYHGTFWQHFRYEWALYRFMRKSFSVLSQTDICGGIDASREAVKIFGMYETLRQSYQSAAQPAFEKDVVFTLRACLDAVTQITRASIREPYVQTPLLSGQ